MQIALSMGDASRQIKAHSLFTLADTSDGALSDMQFAGAPGRRARASTQLPDLLTVIPVVDDQVEYVRVSSRTSAATVAGATVTAYPPARQNITTGATGLKPKGGIVFAKFTEAVRTIALCVPATPGSSQMHATTCHQRVSRAAQPDRRQNTDLLTENNEATTS